MNRFWRGIAIFVLGGVLGTGFGVALGFFIFPYIFPPPVAAEQLADAERPRMCDLAQLHVQLSTYWMRGVTNVSGTRVERIATMSFADLNTPPPPRGPLV